MLIRPSRVDDPVPPEAVFPGGLGQRIETLIWMLKNQLRLEHHATRTTEELWVRVCQRIVALNAAIWRSWLVGAPSNAP